MKTTHINRFRSIAPFILLVILLACFWFDHRSLSNELNILNDEVDSLNHEVSSFSEALDQANENIEDAKDKAWSSYNEMGAALDHLEVVKPTDTYH